MRVTFLYAIALASYACGGESFDPSTVNLRATF